MARGVTLEELIVDLRAEVGQSTNTAVSRASIDALKTSLRRQQERLWLDFDWPHMRVERDITLEAGERYYDFPDDLDPTRVEKVEVKFGGRWIPVKYGITNELLLVHDSDADIRNDPVQNWDYYNGASGNPETQIHLWPIPANNGNATTKELVLRITGIKTLPALISDSDTCALDSWLLVLYSASEILARLKAPDASAKLEAANLYYHRLKGRQGRTESFKIGEGNSDCDREGGLKLRVAYADQDGNLFS